MFFWTVADQDEEGQLVFWRLAFDDTCFYRFDYDGDDLLDEPSAAAPFQNITRIVCIAKISFAHFLAQ